MSAQTQPPSPAAPRFPVIDALRGAALVAMVIYHFAWDLHLFGWFHTDPATDPLWRSFARLIAGSFLFLAGVSLVLAARNGINWSAYGKRLAMIVAAAAAITAATMWLFPDSFIFFGILHHIALASVLALPFVFAPPWLTALAAAAAFALPAFVRADIFAHPALLWVGLAPVPPIANDYVPLLPWFGAVLAGVALARYALPLLQGGAFGRWRPGGRTGRALAAGGRHSLAVYLLHQPLLLGVLWLAAQVLTPGDTAQERSFLQSCTEACRRGGHGAADCDQYCACARWRLEEEGLWATALAPDPSDDDISLMRQATAICPIGTPEGLP